MTNGGKTTAEVEAQFTSKCGDMSKFDAFMDYNVIATTDGLAQYQSTFKADGVKFLAGTWTSPDSGDYTSIIVQVPTTQMILELVQKTSLTYEQGEAQPMSMEQRVPTDLLQMYEAAKSDFVEEPKSSSSVGSIITPLVVGRAVSANVMSKLEDFYVDGMGTSKSHDDSKDGVAKKCFRWTGATMDVCFTQRDDSATSGDFKVSDFENMLNTVHKNYLDGHPLCAMDKWEDNHYAVDSMSADTSKILKYVNEKKPFHYCESGGMGPPPGTLQGHSSANLHYIHDPTGWGIQLDMQFSSAPDDCSSSDATQMRTQDHGNPACTIELSHCSGSPSPSPSPTPTPPSPSPSPSPSPTAHCDQCKHLVKSSCADKSSQDCVSCANNHKMRWYMMGCQLPDCSADVAKACGSSETEELMI